MQSFFFFPLYNDSCQVAIRSKLDLIRNSVNIIKLINRTQYSIEPPANTNKYILINSDIHRLIIKRNDQIHSFHFHLKISANTQTGYLETYHNKLLIDAELSSAILSTIEEGDVLFNPRECAHRVIHENDYEVDGDIVAEIIADFLKHDAGYLRYDYDKERADELLHPLHHFDLYYSDKTALKIGLERAVDYKLMCDILHKNTPAYILKKK